MKIRFVDGPVEGEVIEKDYLTRYIDVPEIRADGVAKYCYTMTGMSEDGFVLYELDKDLAKENW